MEESEPIGPYNYIPDIFAVVRGHSQPCRSPPVLIPTTVCMSQGKIHFWFQSSVVQNAMREWQAVFKKHMKDYFKKSETQKEVIDLQIHEELASLQLYDFDGKFGTVDMKPIPQSVCCESMKLYQYFYRECFQILTPDDFDDAAIDKFLDEFEALQENPNTRVQFSTDELVHSTRLNQDDRDVIAQMSENEGISLRKVLSASRMKVPSVGHLKHYDKHLPYIAYVRF